MNNLNSMILEGNLTRDPETRITSRGTKVVNMDVASNRYYKRDDQQVEEVMYLHMEAWGHTADICESYLAKGTWIRAVGRLRQERWKSADGSPRDRHVLVAEHIEFRNKSAKREESENASETF